MTPETVAPLADRTATALLSPLDLCNTSQVFDADAVTD